MIKKSAVLILWSLLSGAALFVMVFHIPSVLRDYSDLDKPLPLSVREAPFLYHKVADPMEQRQDDYLKNIFHPAFHPEKLLTAEELRLHQFVQQETGMSHKAVWILMRHCEDKDLSLWTILGLIHVETGGEFEKDLVGNDQDRGYMQITPITEKHLFQQYGELWPFSYNPDDIFEPWYNLTLGTKYIQYIMERVMEEEGEENWHRVLGEYNRGPVGLRRLYQWRQTYETVYSRRILQRKGEWKEKYESINMQGEEKNRLSEEW